jgi:hypothetical protein
MKIKTQKTNNLTTSLINARKAMPRKIRLSSESLIWEKLDFDGSRFALSTVLYKILRRKIKSIAH